VEVPLDFKDEDDLAWPQLFPEAFPEDKIIEGSRIKEMTTSPDDVLSASRLRNVSKEISQLMKGRLPS